uniref:Acid-resistance membrane protein n=1 Tax=uncultured bacterium Contig575 TaxID=1393592 RepID=W0FHX4_9BACT|nr:hypothetical protein [uncultured bacterium Contig575]
MDMLFQELGKLKRSSIMNSIILVAAGIMMILCPEPYIDALVSILGYGMVIFAVVLVLEFISGKKVLINYIYLTFALIVALLGVSVLVFENAVLVIGIVFGLLLVGDGVISCINAWMFARRAQRKNWWVLIILSLLMMLFGLILLINPWWNEPGILFDVIGGMLLFSSAVSIVRLIFLWPIKGE